MKRIKVGKWSFEQSEMSAGYHLFKEVEISVKKDGKDTGEKRMDTKIQGYDMPLKSIVNTISEDEAFCEEVHLHSLLERIDNKLDDVTNRILKQLNEVKLICS